MYKTKVPVCIHGTGSTLIGTTNQKRKHVINIFWRKVLKEMFEGNLSFRENDKLNERFLLLRYNSIIPTTQLLTTRTQDYWQRQQHI